MAVCLLGGGILRGNAQDASDIERGIPPVHPRELWKALSGQLETWKLLRSTGETRLGSWIEARAVREYERILPPPPPGKKAKAGSQGEEIPARTRITLIDTGKHADAVSRFEDFSPDGEDDVEKIVIEGCPAIISDFSKTEREVEMLVAGRFLLRISMENQPRRFLAEWIRRIDLKALAAIPGGPEQPLPDVVTIVRLDQLNPEKNQAYRLATTSSGRLDSELQEDEQWLRSAIGEIPEIPKPDRESGPEPGEKAEGGPSR